MSKKIQLRNVPDSLHRRLKARAALAGMFVILLSCAPVRAVDPSPGILDGRWIYDSTRSRQFDPDLQISDTGSGVLHLQGGSLGGPYEFDLRGGSHVVTGAAAVAWHPSGDNRWSITKTRNGKEVESGRVILSGDMLRTEMRGALPNGSPYERNTKWRRQGRGSGLVGLWRSMEVDTGSTFDEFVISTTQDGVVTWRIPTDLQVITGRFDGSDLPVIGSDGPSGSTIAVRAVGSHRFEYVIKRGANPTEQGTLTVSSDGHWLSESTWTALQPKRKSKLVYRRD